MPPSATAARSGVAGSGRTRRVGVGFVHLGGAAVLGTGQLAVLGALFLPWLASGPTTRNSFQLMGLADRYRFFDAWWYRLAPDVWPFWGPAVVAVLVLLVVRLRRTAAALGLVVSALAVVVGSLVLIYGGGRSVGGVHLVDPGPTTLIIGGVLGCVGAVLLVGRSATRLVRGPRP